MSALSQALVKAGVVKKEDSDKLNEEMKFFRKKYDEIGESIKVLRKTRGKIQRSLKDYKTDSKTLMGIAQRKLAFNLEAELKEVNRAMKGMIQARIKLEKQWGFKRDG